MKNKIIVNFSNIISEMETKSLKLCFVRDNNSIFIIDTNNDMYQIEMYRSGSYLEKLIEEGTTAEFNCVDASNIGEWRKEFWGISEVKKFMKHVL
jgi:hypothetical protein